MNLGIHVAADEHKLCIKTFCNMAPVTLKTLVLQQDSACCQTTGSMQIA